MRLEALDSRQSEGVTCRGARSRPRPPVAILVHLLPTAGKLGGRKRIGGVTDRTRIISLQQGARREAARNDGTLALSEREASSAASFRAAFLQHYDVLRQLVEGFSRPGVALLAVDERGVAGSACLAAKDDQANAAIVGRHGMADLYLDGDSTLSLRHLLVVLYPLAGGDEVRVRIVDLRTANAFVDECGRRMEALEAEGPLFLKVARYLLFVLPTGDGIPWPDDPQEGWLCIPERVHLVDIPAEPDRWTRRRRSGARAERAEDDDGEGLCEEDDDRPPTEPHFDPSAGARAKRAGLAKVSTAAGERAVRGRSAARRTIVQRIDGPARATRSLIGEDEPGLGMLRIHSEQGRSKIVVGARAVSAGVLFGRYERCDNDGVTALSNGRISRVHVLLLALGADVYAIDVASTNGTWVGGKEQRVVPLRYGCHLVLGEGLATLEWQRAPARL